MSCTEFCTCKVMGCPHHPTKHNNECTHCILKNLTKHEIPACFWDKIGDTENGESEYTFLKFAKKVMECESK